MITEVTETTSAASTMDGTRVARPAGMAEVSLRDKQRKIATTIVSAGLVNTEITTTQLTCAAVLRG